MCAKCAHRIGNPQKPQKCSQVHTKIAPDQFAQYVARATKFPTGLWRERSVSEREIFYAVFACQRTLEHYRNIPELSSLAMTDPTATRRRGGTMEVAPQRTITKSRRSGYDPRSVVRSKPPLATALRPNADAEHNNYQSPNLSFRLADVRRGFIFGQTNPRAITGFRNIRLWRSRRSACRPLWTAGTCPTAREEPQ